MFAIQLTVQIRNGFSQLVLLLLEQVLHGLVHSPWAWHHILVKVADKAPADLVEEALIPCSLLVMPSVGFGVE